MWAILSDIHSNFEAFRAVMDDIDHRNVERVIILGDIVGYGPQPLECIDMARLFGNLVLLGNHDHAVLVDPDGFGRSAEQAVFWTRDQVEKANSDRFDRWTYLASLPRFYKRNPFLFVHGSPRNPTNEYVFPEDVYNPRKMTRIFACMDQYCFNGHTHVPGILVEATSENGLSFSTPEDVQLTYRLDSRKTIINVGSVGQPRDLDPRACYVLFDGENIIYRRVPYDIDATVKLIYSIPELENFLGDRLREGR
jgi:diadenosine tetraphosphatase ApaH/serine/threonine PP2A family protein phosphatase